jgi:hypothetical protein
VPITEVFATITVRDRDAAIEYDERLLGVPPTMLPNFDERLAKAAAAGIELGPVAGSGVASEMIILLGGAPRA